MHAATREQLRALSFLVLAFALVAPGSAQAHGERWAVPGSIYVGGGVGSEYVNLEEVEGIFAATSNVGFVSNLGSTDGSFWTHSAHAVIGFADQGGLTLPDPIGQNARIELRGRFTRGDSRDTSGIAPLGLLGMANVANPFGANVGGFSIGPALAFGQAIHETRLRTWQGDLLYLTDVELTRDVLATPFVGLTYTRMDFENDFIGVIPLSAAIGPSATNGRLDGVLDIQDDIEADYYGVALGGDLRVRPLDFLELHLGTRVDLMGVNAELSVEQSLNVFQFVRPTESDQDSEFAARIAASFGVSLRAGIFELGLETFASWLSYAPTANHPDLGPAGNPGTDESHISDEDMWSAGWKATLTIWFN